MRRADRAVQVSVGALANCLAEKHLSAPLAGIEHIAKRGEVNQVYLLTTRCERAILRLNHGTELDRFRKEQWCIQATSGQGVPGPTVLAIGHLESRAYLLLSYIEGANGSDIHSSPMLWEALGRSLRLIHQVETEGFGDRLRDITSGDREQWRNFLRYNIAALAADDVLLSTGTLSKSTSQQLQSMFEDLRAKEFTFGLSHGDYSLSNVIVPTGANAVPHIIDWGSARAHIVPHHDLGVILDASLRESSPEFAALLAGYGLARSQYGRIVDDISSLRLLDAIDTLRWATEKAPARIQYHESRVRKFLDTAGL